MLFTTSWDDGYALDLKLAELLDRYGIKATFYPCPRKQHDAPMLTQEQIAALGGNHEIGAHSLRHPRLTTVSAVEARQEIAESKTWIEDITGTECTMFCYPFGDRNDAIRELVRAAGFRGARTTEDLHFAAHDPFALGTSLQIMPFPRRKTWSRWWHPLDPFGPLRVRCARLRRLGLRPFGIRSWFDLAVCLFDYAKNTDQPFFHLWGHSREIEHYRLWEELERFLQHVQGSGARCVVNSEIVR